MASQSELGSEHRPVTIQATSKRIKLMILLGWLSVVAGVVMMFSDDAVWAGAGVAFAVFGFVAALAGKILQWWKHG